MYQCSLTNGHKVNKFIEKKASEMNITAHAMWCITLEPSFDFRCDT